MSSSSSSSSSTSRRLGPTSGIKPKPTTRRSSTPLSEPIVTGPDPDQFITGKEKNNFETRAPFVRRRSMDGTEGRPPWCTDFRRSNSVSVDISARVMDRVNLSNIRGEKWEKKSGKGLGERFLNIFKSKSIGASNGSESDESKTRLRFGGSSWKVSSKGGSCSVGSSVKYRSKLHAELTIFEEKAKRILSDIQRTKEMLDLNNPDASELMVSDTQETVAGIEKDIKELSGDVKSLAKAGLNNDHKLLRDGTTLAKVAVTVIETRPDEKPLTDVVHSCVAISEVQETESTVSYKERVSFNTEKGNIDTMLAADESLEEEFDDEEALIVPDVEFDDSGNDQLNQIGNKTCTGGWFVGEGEFALLAHVDGSCSYYDVVNSEVKSVYGRPAGFSPNLWKDCWTVGALGADGCTQTYVVAASAGNSMDSGFCSWDFYTREIKSSHFKDGVTHTRTAPAPLSNNALNRRPFLSNLTPEDQQWWYKPCGHLIGTTGSNQKAVKLFDIRDAEHVMKWEVKSTVVAMDNSSPLQWRNKGLVVLAETENVSLWDLTDKPLQVHSVSFGEKISALHINNTDAELGGGIRQRLSSSEEQGNDGVVCTSDSIIVLDFRLKSGCCLRIPKHGNIAHSVFFRGDSIYLGCSGSSGARKATSCSQIQQFSLRQLKPFSTYMLPESNDQSHKSITQVWGNSNLTMGVSSLGLFVFDDFKDDGSGQKVRETIGPDNLYSPSFDYSGSRALLISRDRSACWKYLS